MAARRPPARPSDRRWGPEPGLLRPRSVLFASVGQAVRTEVVRLDPDRLNRLPRPAVATGSGVAVGPRGRLACSDYREVDGRGETVAVTSDLRGRQRRVVLRGGVVEVQWTPRGGLLVYFERRGEMRLAVHRGARRVRVVTVPPDSYRVHVSSRGRVAIGSRDGFLLLRRDGTWRRVRMPWRILCWRPEGEALLAVSDERSPSPSPTDRPRSSAGSRRASAWDGANGSRDERLRLTRPHPG